MVAGRTLYSHDLFGQDRDHLAGGWEIIESVLQWPQSEREASNEESLRGIQDAYNFFTGRSDGDDRGIGVPGADGGTLT